MTYKELWDRIMKDTDFEKNAAQSITEQIDEELAKKKPDYEKIAELSEQYSELVGADEEIQSSSDEHCRRILAAARKQNPKKCLFKKIIGLAASLVFILATANCYTVSAYNMNIFKAIVHYASNGFSVDFVSKTAVNDDPYGIRSECEKYGIFAEVPTYLPQGFELTNIAYNDYGICNDVRFNYNSKDMEITIDYQLYTNPEDISNTGFPSDDFNIKEIEINGRPAVISEEDDQFTLVYAKDDILLTIFTQNVPYEECHKITDSIK